MPFDKDVIGWDLGGAHLKLAWLDSDGRLRRVGQWATPLWHGLEHLDQTLSQREADFPLARSEHVLTMTAELVDLFEDRAQGVTAVAERIARLLAPAPMWLYAGPLGFIDPAAASHHWRSVASANWHATATWLAGRLTQGLLVDVGSTTSDLVPFRDGALCNRGYSDRERMVYGELIYAGVVRTPVMAITAQAPFAGDWVTLANELFATMADVYRVLGQLPADADLHPSADGHDKSRIASTRRLARMIGADSADGSEQDWRLLASFLADRQMDALSLASQRQLSRGLTPDAPLIGAGVGRFLVRCLASRLERNYIDIDSLFDTAGEGTTAPGVCAPAVALAVLAAGMGVPCPF